MAQSDREPSVTQKNPGQGVLVQLQSDSTRTIQIVFVLDTLYPMSIEHR